MKVKYQIRKERYEDTYILIKIIETKNAIGSYRIKDGDKKDLKKYLKEMK